jgi:uncharacterized membrane protein YraQ (UPF0718 family)
MLKNIADWLVFRVAGLPEHSLQGEVFNFFVYDVIKIFLLLCVIIFVVSYIRTFFPPERTRQLLAKKGEYASHVAAATLGIFTPFCTCSAIPLFLGFVEAGIPLGVTFTFLVASPMINEVALVILWGMFGWRIALAYVGSGFIIAVVSGQIIARFKPESLLIPVKEKPKPLASAVFELTPRDRLVISRDYTLTIIRTIWPFVIGGIAIGACIHGYVPRDFLVAIAGRNNPFAVPIATLIGIPLYSNAAGVIPMVSALVEKGVGMGTALAFMMAVTGLSLPEFLILKKVMRLKLLLIFAGVVGCGIIIIGYLFNFLIQ